MSKKAYDFWYNTFSTVSFLIIQNQIIKLLFNFPKLNLHHILLFSTRLTILVLIIESRWTESPRPRQFIIENNSTCWLREEYTIIQDCHPCTGMFFLNFHIVTFIFIIFFNIAFEITSKSKGVCIHTHNKEVLKCKPSGETVSRSCDKVAWLDEKNYWQFESSLFVVGVLSSALSIWRQRILDRQTMLKIQRQLGQTV